MSRLLENRYEFVMYFDAENSNPNGDPDAGNMPRIDPETSHGIVTDVCLKRKVRNYVDVVKNNEPPYSIYIREGEVLNNQNLKAYETLDIDPKDKKKAKEGQNLLRDFMCRNFYDIRAFGAVMTTEINCGQVRGPIQFSFSRSVDPVIQQDITITRLAVTNEKDKDKERTMGRKHIIPYGLYRVEGYISATLAKQTNFTERDLELFWQSLINLFEHDRSAARGKMATRKLIVFKHDSELGSAPAHKLFELVEAKKKDVDKPSRSFYDYEIKIDNSNLPNGVEILELA